MLCGAGISRPSGLPDGRGLMQLVLDAFLGRRIAAEIGLPAVRPEVLLRYVAQFEPAKLLRFVRESLSGHRFNDNHLFLAELLGEGQPVITTNFDLLIERACRRLRVGARPFKIHGSIDAPRTMRLTIDHIFSGLPAATETRLRDAVRGRTLLVLGYSGLDQLDVMPALARCAYREVIWIDHASRAAPVRATPREELVAALPRLRFLAYDTSRLVAALLRRRVTDTATAPLRPAAPRIERRTSLLIAAHLLAHENRADDLETFVRRHRLQRDPEFAVLLYEQRAGNLGDAESDRARAALVERIVQLPVSRRRRFYPFLAKSSRALDEIRSVHAMLQRDRVESPAKHEALLELVHRLMLLQKIGDAFALLPPVETFAERTGDTLLSARVLINRAGLQFLRVRAGDAPRRTLAAAARDAERAIYLASEPIFGDRFYEGQARHNLALIRRLQGRTAEAIELYRQTGEIFRVLDAGLYLQTLANLGELYLLANDRVAALRVARQALRFGARLGKSAWRQELLHVKARASAP